LVARLDVDVDDTPGQPSPAGSSTGAAQERKLTTPTAPPCVGGVTFQ
jgi:hypothetical protein